LVAECFLNAACGVELLKRFWNICVFISASKTGRFFRILNLPNSCGQKS